MQTYKQPGEVLSLTAPYDVDSGAAFQVGSIIAVAMSDALSGAAVQGLTCGVFTGMPKTSAQAYTVGQKLYWDNSNKRFDSDGSVGQLAGIAYAVAADPSSTCTVRLNGTAPGTTEGPQANIAALTFGTNITAATANGSLTDSSGTNPTEAQFNELAKELGTKTNAIIAALVAAGILAAP